MERSLDLLEQSVPVSSRNSSGVTSSSGIGQSNVSPIASKVTSMPQVRISDMSFIRRFNFPKAFFTACKTKSYNKEKYNFCVLTALMTTKC